MPKPSPRRGEIYYVVSDPDRPSIGGEQWSDRAGLIVSNDVLNATSNVVEIVYLSTSSNKKLSPTHVHVTSGTKQAIALCEQIHTVDISRLTDLFGTAAEEEMEDVTCGMLFGLQINSGYNPQGIFKKWEKYVKTYPSLLQA